VRMPPSWTRANRGLKRVTTVLKKICVCTVLEMMTNNFYPLYCPSFSRAATCWPCPTAAKAATRKPTTAAAMRGPAGLDGQIVCKCGDDGGKDPRSERRRRRSRCRAWISANTDFETTTTRRIPYFTRSRSSSLSLPAFLSYQIRDEFSTCYSKTFFLEISPVSLRMSDHINKVYRFKDYKCCRQAWLAIS